MNARYVQLLQDAASQPAATVPAGTASVPIREVEPHTVRLAGGTDHGTKFETGASSAKQKRVRSLQTVGGGERTKDSWSTIHDATQCSVRRNVENEGTPDGCPREPRRVEA